VALQTSSADDLAHNEKLWLKGMFGRMALAHEGHSVFSMVHWCWCKPEIALAKQGVAEHPNLGKTRNKAWDGEGVGEV